MNALAAKDPHFFCRFTTDSEDRMVDMFWRDGHSFVDYQCYGDVLIFDSTYKTNVYNRPLVLFVGTNNHRGSIVFGAALLSDETVETYTWLLRKFLDSMNGKMPKAVITDEDEAMHIEIRTVMPEARHRLCIWHIGQNANGHLKLAKKLKAFNRCIRKYQTVVQFDRLWQDMLDEFDLHDNDWINSMYEKRDKFCQAFFRDIFMAGMRSTQRCERMNKDFKLVLSKSKTFVQVVSLVDRTLMRIRNNQERDDFNTMNSFHSAKTHLEDLEKQASSVFTHDVFKWIFRVIMKEAHITLKQGTECHEDGSRVYKVSVYKRPNFEHTVTYYPWKETESAADLIMVCSCGMFEYRGVPCRHMFSVMKENIFHLHKSLIVKRWSRDARSVCEILYPDKEMPQEAVQVSMYGALTADCNRLCFYASKTQEAYNMLKMEIDRLAAIMEGLASDQEKVQGLVIPNDRANVIILSIGALINAHGPFYRRLVEVGMGQFQFRLKSYPWIRDDVELTCNNRNYIIFGTGWQEFVKAYEIHPNDWVHLRFVPESRSIVVMAFRWVDRVRYAATQAPVPSLDPHPSSSSEST
ncbi:PREDICTED: protein FAR1-RELATED SEQUENCE 5-like [Fragaria vesca subsp. vesca]|uniref:protein FAR1-RELATED SEQUENCE 5-like n=1 Tax=Fragaria vesca subsp. vesca TaxID=101020 RepID=UPI0002C34280|nr:PREDICTED: protein FAR1-RELATED SEQUENCE 5-like [Fragaria vesca subsp. vesca]